MLHPASHAGRGNTLEEYCCRTCRRLRAKYRRRPQTVTFTYPTPFDRGRPASDPGAAAHAEAEPMGRSAASQLATVTVTRRSLQPPSCPPSERRRGVAPTHAHVCEWRRWCELQERPRRCEGGDRGEGTGARSYCFFFSNIGCPTRSAHEGYSQRQAGERPRRGRARRSRADGTISGLAVGHCD